MFERLRTWRADRFAALRTRSAIWGRSASGTSSALHRAPVEELAASGTPEEIANRLMKTGNVRIEIRGDGRAIKAAIEQVQGVVRTLWSSKGDLNTYLIEPGNGVDLRPALVRACAAGGWDVYELGYERLSLEEAFSILTAAPAKGASS